MRKKISVSVEGITKRRFHNDVRKLKKQCEQHHWTLLAYEDVEFGYFICVLSEDEYEIGEQCMVCSSETENYFLSPNEYEQYVDIYLN